MSVETLRRFRRQYIVPMEVEPEQLRKLAGAPSAAWQRHLLQPWERVSLRALVLGLAQFFCALIGERDELWIRC